MIADAAQARPLGHVLPDKIADVYSYVAAEVEARLVSALQHPWDKAIANSLDHAPWRCL